MPDFLELPSYHFVHSRQNTVLKGIGLDIQLSLHRHTKMALPFSACWGWEAESDIPTVRLGKATFFAVSTYTTSNVAISVHLRLQTEVGSLLGVLKLEEE